MQGIKYPLEGVTQKEYLRIPDVVEHTINLLNSSATTFRVIHSDDCVAIMIAIK
jgi:hypothetical protein